MAISVSSLTGLANRFSRLERLVGKVIPHMCLVDELFYLFYACRQGRIEVFIRNYFPELLGRQKSVATFGKGGKGLSYFHVANKLVDFLTVVAESKQAFTGDNLSR